MGRGWVGDFLKYKITAKTEFIFIIFFIIYEHLLNTSFRGEPRAFHNSEQTHCALVVCESK